MRKNFPSRRPDFSYHGLVVPCALCGSRDSEWLTKKDRDGYKTFKTLCCSCGLVYTNPLPTIEELQVFYQKKFDKMATGGFQPQLQKIYRAGIRALGRYNRIKPYLTDNATILDASACMGELCYLLKAHGYSVEGIECNPHFVKYAKEELNIELQPHFLDNITLHKEAYNIILSHHIVNLCLHPLQLLKKYHHALKPQGILNLEVPNIEARYTTPFNRFRFKQFYNFNIPVIEMLARKTGFDILNTIVLPNKHHINIIMQKSRQQKISIANIDNYLQVRKNIFSYTNLDYLLSKTPYVKMLTTLKRRWQLNKISHQFTSARKILDSLYFPNAKH